tara:strand:- start:1278 stop:2114 length:837 start_codon:yes stop_codon:yes gene_type:complete
MKIDFGLYIVATPIGNLGDISERAIGTIKSADFIVCENPKHSLKLLNKLGIKKKLISIHDYNENTVIERISNDLIRKKCVLISDAGSPLISDPGFKLIQYCINNNIEVTSIPGPTAIIPSLQLSGIPVNEFSFLGFFPKSKKGMNDFVKKIKNSDTTCVFFVSSHKLNECVELLDLEIRDRLISISKELTKLNERIYRGFGPKIKKMLVKHGGINKGEFVAVVEGGSQKIDTVNELENYKNEVNKLLSKFSLTDVVQIVHKLTGITKNKVYKWILSLK